MQECAQLGLVPRLSNARAGIPDVGEIIQRIPQRLSPSGTSAVGFLARSLRCNGAFRSLSIDLDGGAGEATASLPAPGRMIAMDDAAGRVLRASEKSEDLVVKRRHLQARLVAGAAELPDAEACIHGSLECDAVSNARREHRQLRMPLVQHHLRLF